MQDLISDFEKKRLNYASRFGILAGLIGFISSWIFYDKTEPVLLFFDFSTVERPNGINIGLVCFILTGAICLVYCFIAFKALLLESDGITPIEKIALKGRQNLVARITVSIVVTAILLVFSWFFWIVVGLMFTNLRMPFVNALLVTTLYAGFLGFYISRWASVLDTQDVMWLTIVTFVFGLLGSFLLADDPEWWRVSLSYLGADSGSNTLFSWSLISVSVLMLSLWRDLINTLNVLCEAGKIKRWSLNALVFGATVSSIGIIGVAVFTSGASPFLSLMHNISVQSAASIFIIGMLGIRWIIPNIFHPNFIRLGYWYTALCIVFFLLYQFTDMLNFVALEVFSFIVFTIWIYYFNEYILLYVRHQDIEEIKVAVEKANRPLWEQLQEIIPAS
ncbi:MAG: hypothetical protein Phog2KO_20250 [Phototrophicaceae bacterium]